MLPFIAHKGKVVFVGSMSGKIKRITNEEIKEKLRSEHLTREQLFALMADFGEGRESRQMTINKGGGLKASTAFPRWASTTMLVYSPAMRQ